MKLLRDILARKAEIKTRLEKNDPALTDEELGTLDTELRQLEADELKVRTEGLLERSRTPAAAVVVSPDAPAAEERAEVEDKFAKREYRSAFFRRLQGKALTSAEQRSLDTGTGSAGYAIPTTTLNMIKEKLFQYSVLWPLISKSFIPGNLNVPVSNAQADAAWHTQNGAVNPVDDTLVVVNLNGYELIKLVRMSRATWLMTVDAFEAYIVGQITKKLGRAIENAILNGTGTTNPTGILVGVTFDASNSATWDKTKGLLYDDVVSCVALLPTMYHQNARFIMPRATLFGSVRLIKDAFGRPIFVPDARETGPGTILGYEVVMDDLMPADTILFGDLDYYHANVQEGPIIDISTESGFTAAAIDYRGYMLMDSKPLLSEAFVKYTKSA